MRQTLSIVLLLAGMGSVAVAQDRYANDPFSNIEARPSASDRDTTTSEPAPESYSSHDAWPESNFTLVQKNAMFRADQRRQRLASMRWLGLSKSRPYASATPQMTSSFYTTGWAGNYWGPFSWYSTTNWR